MDHVPISFRVGERYSSKEIQAGLSVGNAGGLRVVLNEQNMVRRLVVMTSVPSSRQMAENPYHDRIEGDTLIYTGAGREGDQVLAGANKRIPQQFDGAFPIYGFLLVGSRRDAKLGEKRWQFLGLLEYERHYPDRQLDVRRQVRGVWLFEFHIHHEPTEVIVAEENRVVREILALERNATRERVEDREVVDLSSEAIGDRQIVADPVETEAERRRLLALSPGEFEHLIRDVLVESGYEQVHATRFSQDGGIDVNAFAGPRMWPIRGLLLQVQAKRWLHTVGRKEVAELRGSLQPFARGAVVTTSHFSRAAIAEAAEPGKNPIVLVDGYSFAESVRSIRIQERASRTDHPASDRDALTKRDTKSDYA